VLYVGDIIYVVRGGRTNTAGIRQLRTMLEPTRVTIVGVPIHKDLHLKSAITVLPDRTIVDYRALTCVDLSGGGSFRFESERL
jgi:dimethylargininase